MVFSQFFHFVLSSLAIGVSLALTLILIKLESFPALMAEGFSSDFVENTIIAEGRAFHTVSIQLGGRECLRPLS